jgi:hypothetical protein
MEGDDGQALVHISSLGCELYLLLGLGKGHPKSAMHIMIAVASCSHKTLSMLWLAFYC